MPVPRKTIADRHDFKHRLIALNGRLGYLTLFGLKASGGSVPTTKRSE